MAEAACVVVSPPLSRPREVRIGGGGGDAAARKPPSYPSASKFLSSLLLVFGVARIQGQGEEGNRRKPLVSPKYKIRVTSNVRLGLSHRPSVGGRWVIVEKSISSYVHTKRIHRLFHAVCNTVYLDNLSDLNRLENCTTIEGSLVIKLGLINADPDLNETYSYPKLREITDFLMVYKANKLRTLNHLFPNLAVIRGNKLVSVSHDSIDPRV